MAEELFIPKLGQTVEEVTLINWLVKDGDKVKQGQEVLEVETDKAVFNVEATDSGYIHIGPFQASQVIPVLTVVALIGEENEQFIALKPVPEKPTEKDQDILPTKTKAISENHAPANQKLFVSPRARKLAAAKGVDLSAVTPGGANGQRVRKSDVLAYLNQTPKASRLAQRMAEEAGLDLQQLQGSGLRGEITKTDVENALEQKTSSSKVSSVTSLPPMEVAEQLPLKGVRRVIADRMGTSVHTTARVTLLMEVDATELVTLREKLKTENEKKWGFAPGYNDLLAKVCALALRRFPYMNACLNEKVIEWLARVNIGIAVDAERGLYVPVIRDADQKDLFTLGKEFRQRVEEIRSGKILPENLSGGTFTITNLGMYDVDGFTPVINLPEAAILGIGRIAPKAVVRDDQIVVRKMLTLSLVFDHRLVDGAPAAKFLKYLKELIESPDPIFNRS